MDLDSITSFIKKFDYFGYTPKFRINGNDVYKSSFGGLIFIFFIIYSLYLLTSQLIIFLNNINIVKTSRILFKDSESSYLLTTSDIYLGLGLVDVNQKEFNSTEMFPYLIFDMSLIIIDKFSNKTKIPIELGKCDMSKFIGQSEFDTYSSYDIANLNNKLAYYVCPVPNSTFNYTPDMFGTEHIYIDFDLNLKNTSILSQASDDLNIFRPRLNLIFKQYKLNFDSKSNPYEPFIENIFTNLDFDFIKKNEILISPLEIKDDDYFFTTGSFKYYINNLLGTQTNGTVFSMSHRTSYFERVWNRTAPVQANNMNPLLYLAKFLIRMSPTSEITLRTYDNLSNFLANVSAVLSNILIIFMIIMTKVNEINGKNLLLESMFSFKTIKNMIKFHEDFNKKYKNLKIKEKDSPLKDEKMEENKNVNSLMRDMSFGLEINNESRPNNPNQMFIRNSALKDNSIDISKQKIELESSKNINEVELKLSNDQVLDKTDDIMCNFEPNKKVDEILEVPKEEISENGDEIKHNGNLSRGQSLFQMKKKKTWDLLNNMKFEDFKFKFCDYFKSYVSHKIKDKVYQIANKNLHNCLEISEYLRLNQEVGMIKEFIMDKKQTFIFNTFSTVINFKKLFKEFTKIYQFENYEEDEYNKIFETLKFIKERHNDEDLRILRFIKLKSLE